MAQSRPDHKTYVKTFGMTLSLSLTALLTAAFYIQPLEGDLTRLGSYSERYFGRNAPQKKIFCDANSAEAYDGKSDVLIIGDSFSLNGMWQPFFRQKTGLSYITMNIRKTSLHNLMKSEEFRKHPPKIMIVQNAERDFIRFYKDRDFNFCNDQNFSSSTRPHNDIHIRLQGFDDHAHGGYEMDYRKTLDLQNINLRYAASVVLSSAFRSISGKDSGDTRRFLLTRSSFFSNLRSGEILIYAEDMDKLSWRKEDLAKAVCSIRRLQDMVQSNGKTLFIFLLATDKSTAYSEYIASPVFQNIPDTPQMMSDNGINAPRIDVMLKKAINGGEKDIYDPGGTHWTARGFEIAAEGTADFIRKHAVISVKTSRDK